MTVERLCDETQCDGQCAGCTLHERQAAPGNAASSFLEQANPFSNIKKVIGVMSGKGGVGKSLTAAMLAVLFRREGYNTAILDADVTGPSIPKMFDLTQELTGDERGITPAQTHNAIQVISTNLLLPTEDTPVIWRGPVVSGTVRQFWTDVAWGDVDVLFIDMPPGTGDIPLTVFQALPVDGVIIVTSPQDLVGMIVKKAYNMAQQMSIPVLGFVENMSYVQCPDCGEKIYVYGHSRLEETAAELGVPVLAKMPIDPALAGLCDEGNIELFYNDYLDGAVAYLKTIL